MTSLTPEQVRQLTPDQQDTLGALEAARIRRRLELVAQVRGYRGRRVFPVIIILVLAGVVIFGFSRPGRLPLPVLLGAALFAVLLVMQFHIAGLNRRLDALVKLLEAEERL